MELTSRSLRLLKRFAKSVLPEKVYQKLREKFFRLVMKDKKAKHRFAADPCLPAGVNLFTYFYHNSAGSIGVLLKQALDASGIPYQVFDLGDPEKFRAEAKDKTLYQVNLVTCHAASGAPARLKLFGIDFSRHYNICNFLWELPEVPDEFCAGMDMFQEIWASSSFCTSALEKKTRVPVLTIPLHANKERTVLKNGRKYFGFDEKAFLFMFAYDCNSFVERKNPQAVVKAFMKAFPPENANVGLVLKLLYPQSFQEHIEELKRKLAPYRNIYYIDQYLSDDETRTLLQASDAFVSLHRSEGFGLLPLEAMSLGIPVISTAWSGNMEYMNHMNTALVGYRLVPVDGKYVGSKPGDSQVWAQADVDEAAAYMRRMVSDPAWRERLAAAGRYTADQCYTPEKVGKMMRDRLVFLGLM